MRKIKRILDLKKETINYINKCNSISYITEPLYYYVMHDGSTMNSMTIQKKYNQLNATIEVIDLLKKDNISKVYYKYESMFILIAMDYLYTNTDDDYIRKKVKEYVKDGCIRNENKKNIRMKLVLAVLFPHIFQLVKKIKRKR